MTAMKQITISFVDLDVYDTLLSLDTSKAMGIDGIVPRLPNKHCTQALLTTSLPPNDHPNQVTGNKN